MDVHICTMRTKRVNIRLDLKVHAGIQAILQEIQIDPMMLPSDLTAFINKACQVYVDRFRGKKRYKSVIERAEKAFNRTKPLVKVPDNKKLIAIPSRKNVQSVRTIATGDNRNPEEEFNEVA